MIKPISLFALAFITSCTAVKAPIVEPVTVPANHWPKNSIRENLTGAWGWDAKQCASDPIHIAFSSDGKAMYHRTQGGLTLGNPNKAIKIVAYKVLAESDHILRTQIQGEDRRSKSGALVKWDLILFTENKFCWRRSDWSESDCTQALTSCRQEPEPE